MLFDAKNFNGEVFGKYVERIPKVKLNELLKSRAIVKNDSIKALFNEQVGGNYAVTPMFGRIGGTPVNYDGATDITDSSTKTYTQARVVVGRAAAWTERDFSQDIAGGTDFMDNVAAQISEYWEDIDQDTILAVLKGVFSMTGAKNLEFVNGHTIDITDDVAVEKRVFNGTTLNTAMQKALGDNKAKFSMAIMHSAVSTNLENLNLIANLKYTDANGIERELGLGTLNGRLIVIDDSMPTVDVPESVVDAGDGYTKFTSYVLGDGAIELTDVGVTVPYEMDRNPKVNGGQTTLYSRQRKVMAPYGLSFTKASMVSLSPTNVELENGANWSLVNSNESSKDYISHKAIPIARIVSIG